MEMSDQSLKTFKGQWTGMHFSFVPHICESLNFILHEWVLLFFVSVVVVCCITEVLLGTSHTAIVTYDSGLVYMSELGHLSSNTLTQISTERPILLDALRSRVRSIQDLIVHKDES